MNTSFNALRWEDADLWIMLIRELNLLESKNFNHFDKLFCRISLTSKIMHNKSKTEWRESPKFPMDHKITHMDHEI